MHQRLWLRAIEDIQAEGIDSVPVPEAFDVQEELEGFDRLFIQASDGASSAEGSWASGPAPDGRGNFSTAKPSAYGERPVLPPGDPRLYGTPSQPMDSEGMVGKIKDALT